MEQEHTPGPWEVDGTYIYEVDQSRIIAEVETYNNDELPYEANARLMAAAPELLEAIKESMWYIDFGDSGANKWYEETEKLIAKIEGNE